MFAISKLHVFKWEIIIYDQNSFRLLGIAVEAVEDVPSERIVDVDFSRVVVVAGAVARGLDVVTIFAVVGAVVVIVVLELLVVMSVIVVLVEVDSIVFVVATFTRI